MKTRDLQAIADLAAASAGRREEFYGRAFSLLKESFRGKEPVLLLFHPERRTFFRRIVADETGRATVRAISLALEEFPKAFAEALASGSPFRGQGPYPFDLPEFTGTFLCHPVPFGARTLGLLVTGDEAVKGETTAPFVVPLVEAFTVAEWHRESSSLAPQAAERAEAEQVAALQEKYRRTYGDLEAALAKATAAEQEREALRKQSQKATAELQSMASELSLLRLDMIETGGVRNVIDALEGPILDGLPSPAEAYLRETLDAAGIERALLFELPGVDPVIAVRSGDWSGTGTVEQACRIVGPLIPLADSRRQAVGLVMRGGRAEVVAKDVPADLLLVPIIERPTSRLEGVAMLAGGALPWPPQAATEALASAMSAVLAIRGAERRAEAGVEARALKAGIVRGLLKPLTGRRSSAASLRGALLLEIDFTVADNPDRPPDRIAGAIDQIVRDTGLVPLHPLYGRLLAFHPAVAPPVDRVIAAVSEIRLLLGQQRPKFLLGFFPLTVLAGAVAQAAPWIHTPFLAWAQTVLPSVPDGGIALSPNLARGAGLSLKLEERQGFFLAG